MHEKKKSRIKVQCNEIDYWTNQNVSKKLELVKLEPQHWKNWKPNPYPYCQSNLSLQSPYQHPVGNLGLIAYKFSLPPPPKKKNPTSLVALITHMCPLAAIDPIYNLTYFFCKLKKTSWKVKIKIYIIIMNHHNFSNNWLAHAILALCTHAYDTSL